MQYFALSPDQGPKKATEKPLAILAFPKDLLHQMAVNMFYPVVLVSLMLTVSAVHAVKIGDSCSNHTSCNYAGSDPIQSAACTSKDPKNPGTCQCGPGYYGEAGWKKCLQSNLGDDCGNMTDGETYCQTGVPNSVCPSGKCVCRHGYYRDTTWLGKTVCLPINDGAPCDSTEKDKSDKFCQRQMKGAVCNHISETCSCPFGMAFVPSDKRCRTAVFTTECRVCHTSGGVCYTKRKDQKPSGCECPANKRSSGNNSLTTGCDIGQAEIDDMCDPSGSIECVAKNTVCKFSPGLTERYFCVCKPGYAAVPSLDNPEETQCYKVISSQRDPTCSTCEKNRGTCYDVNEDGARDGCKCQTSRTSSNPRDYRTDCDTTDLNVTCSATRMDISFLPHNATGLPNLSDSLLSEDSALYVKGQRGRDPCIFEYDMGSWKVSLPLEDHVCGMKARFPLPSVISYQNWVVLKVETAMGSKFVHFHAYCNFDIISKAVTKGVDIVDSDESGASEGERVHPELDMSLFDQFGREESEVGARIGQPSQLFIKMTNDKDVYAALIPEVCIASNSPELSNPTTQSQILLFEGCPVKNSPIDMRNTFHHSPVTKKSSRTGFFPMISFDKTDYIFFHCAVKVCRDISKCREPSCSSKKKRSADEVESSRITREAGKYEVDEEEWEMAKTPAIQLIINEKDVIEVEKKGSEPSQGNQVCIAGVCLSRRTYLGIIIGTGIVAVIVLVAIVVVIANLIIKRNSFDVDDTTASEGNTDSDRGSDVGESFIDDEFVYRLPNEFFWEETISNVNIPRSYV